MKLYLTSVLAIIVNVAYCLHCYDCTNCESNLNHKWSAKKRFDHEIKINDTYNAVFEARNELSSQEKIRKKLLALRHSMESANNTSVHLSSVCIQNKYNSARDIATGISMILFPLLAFVLY